MAEAGSPDAHAGEDIIELELDGLGPRGDACGSDADGRPIYVAGGIPGERVRARVYKRGRHSTSAEMIALVRPSPHRVEAPCPLFGHCNGCQLQHVAIARQLELKHAMVADQLVAVGLEPACVRAPVAAPSPWHYRNHARFTVKRGRLGFVRRHRHAFFEVPQCLLMEPRINTLLATLQGRLQETTQCNIRVGAPADAISIQPRLSLDEPASGQPWVIEVLGGRSFRVSTPAFFQVHRAQAERMVEIVRAAVLEVAATSVLDAFAGVGTFAALLAAHVDHVVAVEESGPAVRDASYNFGGLSNVALRLGKAEQVLRAMVDEDAAIDVVLVDPPRAGCLPDALDAIIALRPRRVVYVSCDPGSLARDLRAMVDRGYALAWVQPLDMFPHTVHIEAIAVLDRPCAGPPV